MAQYEIARRKLLQGVDPGGWRVRSPAKALRTSVAREAQPALVSRRSSVPASEQESITVRTATSRFECRRILSAVARIRGSNRRVRLQEQSLVTENGTKTSSTHYRRSCRG